MKSKRIFLSPPWMGGSERARVEEAFASGYIAPCGPMVERFEREFSAATRVPFACALTSGTAGLDLLFHELEVGRGDTVFCSDLTFVASVAPAVKRGAQPVFIDSDEESWTMNPALLAEALADASKVGKLPKAVVAVDLYGQCCDYARIEALCAEYGVALIVDAAEALGALYYGGGDGGGERSAGDAGWAAVYSFNGNKIITASGGGMVASKDGALIERTRRRAQQAREAVCWYEHKELGYNYRMSSIMAAVGVGQLEWLAEIVARKRRIFEWYRRALSGVEGLRFMPEAQYGRCTRWLTVVELAQVVGEGRGNGKPSKRVLEVVQALEARGIEARPIWKPMHLQPVFEGAKVYGGSVGERLFGSGVCLPSGVGMSEAEVERVKRGVWQGVGCPASRGRGVRHQRPL